MNLKKKLKPSYKWKPSTHPILFFDDRGTFEVQRSALVLHRRWPRQGRGGALGLDQEGTAHGRLPTGLAVHREFGNVGVKGVVYGVLNIVRACVRAWVGGWVRVCGTSEKM